MGERVTDSAGVTCEYTPIEELEPGNVVILGWRHSVKRVEVEKDRARVVWQRTGVIGGVVGEFVDQWNPLGTLMPVEVQTGGGE